MFTLVGNCTTLKLLLKSLQRNTQGRAVGMMLPHGAATIAEGWTTACAGTVWQLQMQQPGWQLDCKGRSASATSWSPIRPAGSRGVPLEHYNAR
jgi:hypothetical protein